MLQAEGIARIFFRNGKGTNFFYAVEKTDFELSEGSLTEIVGRSGSGKSTFANMLAGLLTPTEGRVLLDGEDLYAMDDTARSVLRNKKIGMIPQGQTALQSLTVMENVLVQAAMYGHGAEHADRAKDLLEQMEIGRLADVYAGELSGGELRRLAIARALVMRPEILIADEPTGDLDDENTVRVMRLLREYADAGAAVLMVTHEKEAAAYADSVWRMEKGVLRRERGSLEAC